MDIKILHIDSNNPILMRQLQELGFENHEDFTSSKKNKSRVLSWDCYSPLKIDKLFRQSELQFIARVGAGLESIDCAA
jgi:D-3-phosphoglycerate dehydrogenase